MRKFGDSLKVVTNELSDSLGSSMATVLVMVLFAQEYNSQLENNQVEMYLILAALVVVNLLSPLISKRRYYQRLYIVSFTHLGWLALVLLSGASGPFVVLVNLSLIVITSFWLDYVAIILSTTSLSLALAINSANYGTQQTIFMVASQLFLGVFLLQRQIRRTTLLERRESKLTEAIVERERLQSLINSMADGVVATDESGTVVLYNGAALDILNVNASLVHKQLRDFLHLKDSRDKDVDLFEKAQKAKAYYVSRDFRLKIDENESINVFSSIAPVRIGYGKQGQRGFILLFRDITREKTLEEERDEFISVVSHELRTPITIAEGNISNAKLLIEKAAKSVDKTTNQAIDDAHKQVVFLAEMINDLSTLSRAERGVLHVEPESIDPQELVESLERDYHIEAEQKGLEFKTKIDKSTPHIISSRLYIREILQNFITNAIKYTEKGSVSLELKANKNGNATFIISDTGIGVSKSDQKKLFDKFFRSEDYRTRAHSGTGLGLYVTQKLAVLIKAKIDLKSDLNRGSTFTITIPSLKKAPSHKS